MLCDALENKGASPSGIPHNAGVAQNADRYRDVLKRVRSKSVTFEDLIYELHLLNYQTVEAAGTNQIYRIEKIVKALDIFIMKEYQKHVTL